jgi:hypothetical protein
MNYKICLILLMACMIAGCSDRYVLCISPTDQFTPHSESELLAELNSHLPFVISDKDFISKEKTGGLVGWAVVYNEEQKDIIKARLKNSATLKLLQVEKMTPEFEKLMK